MREAGLGVCAGASLEWNATAVVSSQWPVVIFILFVVALDSLLYGEVTSNVVPNDLGRFRPEADLVMLCRGGYSSHG